MARKKQEDRQCIFCSFVGKMSREHHWPVWLRPYLPRVHNSSKHLTARYNQHGDPVFEKGIFHTRRPPEETFLPVVCEQCNNTWMSQINEGAKTAILPLMHGAWPDFSDDLRTKLASWMTLYSMVIEFAHPTTVVVPRHERLAFKDHPIPSENWLIYFGRYHGREWHLGFWHRCGNAQYIDAGNALLIKPLRVPGPGRQNTMTVTFCIGESAFHATRFPTGVPYHHLRNIGAVHLRALWPLSPMAPPPPVLNDDGIDRQCRTRAHQFYERLGFKKSHEGFKLDL